ncbi:glycosyltransferase family 9 protein [Alteromonadaceae bacterium BrNp21-10]|nr:glycosyltransferase family 9 protein [Alteromonadaceae bacterium BrNp21-10]
MKKLCLMRLSAIGDVCHAVAMVERIQRHWPDCQITWIIGKIEYQLLATMPGIEFVQFDKSLGKQAFKKLRQDLGKQQFDALLVMQVALRANIAARQINAKVKIGFDWHRSKELHWLFTNRRISPQPHAHVLEGFMGFADALGVPAVDDLRWPIPVDAEAKTWAQQQCQALGEFVIISPAASKAERNWLPERYAAITDYLQAKGKKVVLCGGPGKLDQQISDAILQHTSAIAENYVGQTSLKHLLALIAEAELVIAPDTGPAHMATTVNTPVIGLYAHSNPRRTGPYRDLQRVVSVYDEVILKQTGKSWQQLPWGKRAKGADLMARISTQSVIDKIDQWLQQSTVNAVLKQQG